MPPGQMTFTFCIQESKAFLSRLKLLLGPVVLSQEPGLVGHFLSKGVVESRPASHL